MTDPFGQALLDHARDERTAPLWQVDGEWEREHPIEKFYFEPRPPDGEVTAFLETHLQGPSVDLGAGVGRDVAYFGEQFETVGLERSPALVTAMHERGLDARRGDMFALRETFDRDRFASALSVGTQLGLARSLGGVRSFLSELAYVTQPGATAVVDAYDPTTDDAHELLGYRGEPTRGLASRVMHFRYEGVREETLLFRLFSPERLREAVAPTRWRVVDSLASDGAHYRIALQKE
ncbi:class I SAM-dependent methyltransferase [Halobaculum sp. MBLA0143]|uniref:class I SAM-dependent methyltransferase n=1 Tax=Halobaculum sp. MBLA0143 TaxID=3079933 RepID=UPI003525DC46